MRDLTYPTLPKTERIKTTPLVTLPGALLEGENAPYAAKMVEDLLDRLLNNLIKNPGGMMENRGFQGRTVTRK